MSTYRIGRYSDPDLDKLVWTVWEDRNPDRAWLVATQKELEAIRAEAEVVPEPGDEPAEPEWSVTTMLPPPRLAREQEHTATVDGLRIRITQPSHGYAYWTVDGFLGEVAIEGHDYSSQPLEQAKATAVRAARRMFAAGIRGEKRAPEAEQ